MLLEPKIKDDTLFVNSSRLSSSTPSPQISTSTPLYLNPQIAPLSLNYTIPNNFAGEGEDERDGSGEKKEEIKVERSDEVEEPMVKILKTWNLRPRKLATKPEDKVNIGSSSGGRSRMGVASTRESKPRFAKSRARPSLERPVVKKERGFVFALTKEEIEHDFMHMTGEKPPKKPLKRPKIVQKNLDVLFPSMKLTNVTPDKYGVNDNPPSLKC
ncbi:uncharacterized protein LOC127135698 [Lathyrus oleraceus]|uniref:Uncharacterized protein n=1 Tax=Pisum sativum TaxID=3888 RepID=A0A9D4XLT3_PEA|nr:uncharacterized protein LOC127135698 [Pisum sativum]KAI5423359.1 hypothetical protein KIW84_046360 [Pisum sativum]